jgi:hypothetical protein
MVLVAGQIASSDEFGPAFLPASEFVKERGFGESKEAVLGFEFLGLVAPFNQQFGEFSLRIG